MDVQLNLQKVQGLNNIGNTCFMNSVLQLIFRCSAFTKYMINILNNDKLQSKQLKSYSITLKDYYNPKVTSLEPTVIKRFIADTLPEFVGFMQHDAHEFLIHILDVLDESLKSEKESLGNLSSITPDNIISKLFDCKLYSEIKSLESESKTLIKEPDRIVALPIPEKENPTLNDCIQLYCQSEKLDGDNKWFDEKNNKKVVAEKNIKICNCPKYFLITFKRYKVNGNQLYKLNTKIDIPLEWKYSKYTYRCRGFIVQSGGLSGGHYIAFVKQDDKWYCCNDSNVSTVNDEQIKQLIGLSYILLYVKQK